MTIPSPRLRYAIISRAERALTAQTRNAFEWIIFEYLFKYEIDSLSFI